MSHNLNLLRQTCCRPATVTGKTTNYLFPLEKECGVITKPGANSQKHLTLSDFG
jgi:hypothetical protein